jgi:hypothetical protein
MWLILAVRSDQSHPKIVTPEKGRTAHPASRGVRVHLHHFWTPVDGPYKGVEAFPLR